MASNTVKLTIKVSDEGGFKQLEVDSESLREAIKQVKEEADELNRSVVNWSQAAQAFDTMNRAVDQLNGMFGELTAAYRTQITAESRLKQVMQNTMGATDADVEAIKRLCAAQQELGVVGDEVQLAGAQELATYLEERSSLEQLIPVMNDMVAQQYGMEASGESAAQIATMLGKVMQGQTAALSRYGYSFTEVQEKILKTGTEAERAAVLMEVVEESVGGVNAALAQTDSGQLKQLENSIGDVKETIGGLVQPLAQTMTKLSEIGRAAGGVGQLASSFKAVWNQVGPFLKSLSRLTLQESQEAAAARSAAQAHRTQAAAQGVATASTKALTASTIALQAALTMGVALAVTAVVALFSRLGDKADEAAERVDVLKEANETYAHTAAEVKTKIDQEVAALQSLIEAQGNDKAKVEELNRTYGTAFGVHRTAAEWYDTLTSKSKTYCMQLGYEAQARTLAAQIAQKEIELEQGRQRADEMRQNGTATQTEKQLTTQYNAAGQKVLKRVDVEVDTEAFAQLKQENAQLSAELQQLNRQLDLCTSKAAEAQAQMAAAAGNTDATIGWETMGYTELGEAIKTQQKRVESLMGVNDTEGQKENAKLTKMIARQHEMEVQYGKTSEAGKKAAKEAEKALEMPDTTETIGQVEQALQVLQSRRKTATGEALAEINQEIARLNELKTQYEETGIAAQKAKEKAAPGAIETLDTLEKLSDAESYYDEKVQTATGAELLGYARQKAAIEAKRKALQQLTDLPQQQARLDDLNGLSGKTLKVQLELIGLSEVQNKIKQLEELLSSMGSGMDDSTRSAVEAQIASWKSYEKQLKKSQVTFKGVWSSTKSVGSGVEGITDAIEGDGNAWDKLTGVVDGAISVMDGISGIVQVVKTLTGATEGQTSAQTAGTAATTANAVAQGAQATASGNAAASAGVNAGVMEGEAQAAQQDATAQILLAGSKTMAAHASIPFVGIAIAGGLIATMTAIMLALPKFANGGIAYGPTLGLFGEYAGASTNPEVVAPLSKLRELLGTDEGSSGGQAQIRLRAKGRDLVGVYEREQRFRSRR
jgi:hypothetical protein